jgi:hypothetical protein
MNRVLDWDTRALPRVCGQFVRDQAGVWHKVVCDESGWQVGFLHRRDSEEACRLLNEVQARLPLPILADNTACSDGLNEPSGPGDHSGDLCQESVGFDEQVLVSNYDESPLAEALAGLSLPAGMVTLELDGG